MGDTPIDVAHSAAEDLLLRVAIGACQSRARTGEGDAWVAGTYHDPTDKRPTRIVEEGASVTNTEEEPSFERISAVFGGVPRYELRLGRQRPFALSIETGASLLPRFFGGGPGGGWPEEVSLAPLPRDERSRWDHLVREAPCAQRAASPEGSSADPFGFRLGVSGPATEIRGATLSERSPSKRSRKEDEAFPIRPAMVRPEGFHGSHHLEARSPPSPHLTMWRAVGPTIAVQRTMATVSTD